MGTEIQITITPDTDFLARDQIDGAMARTLRLLSAETEVPTRKLSMTIKCDDDDADRLKDALHAALSGRPVGIEVKLKTICEEYVARQSLPRTTPMDRIAGFADRHGVSSVTLRSGDREATLTPETARNAAAMLRDEPIGSDGPPRR